MDSVYDSTRRHPEGMIQQGCTNYLGFLAILFAIGVTILISTLFSKELISSEKIKNRPCKQKESRYNGSKRVKLETSRQIQKQGWGAFCRQTGLFSLKSYSHKKENVLLGKDSA